MFHLSFILMYLSILILGQDRAQISVQASPTALFGFGQHHQAIRRMDCSVFCRRTGFNGYVGGCQCGFTLFASKRSPSQSGVPAQPLLLAARILVPASGPELIETEPEVLSANSPHKDDSSDV